MKDKNNQSTSKTDFKCGEERVYGETRCEKQCKLCAKEYSNYYLEDKLLTMMQLLENTGATFEDRDLSLSIIVETFKNI